LKLRDLYTCFNFLTGPLLKQSHRTTMAPSKLSPTDTKWSHQFDTLRRENLFRNPPKDHTAYPLLKEAIQPHIQSFNALFEKDGLITKGIKDIGTKVYLDGDERAGPAGKNKLSVRVKEVFVEKSMLPPSNKFSTRNREILPAECRERHCTYRGKMSARLEYRINNGDPVEFIRELGQIPLMLMVCANKFLVTEVHTDGLVVK
jgi:DNA-directed RNA polymerase I subunit RPA2